MIDSISIIQNNYLLHCCKHLSHIQFSEITVVKGHSSSMCLTNRVFFTNAYSKTRGSLSHLPGKLRIQYLYTRKTVKVAV